jgi:hypothetical protein
MGLTIIAHNNAHNAIKDEHVLLGDILHAFNLRKARYLLFESRFSSLRSNFALGKERIPKQQFRRPKKDPYALMKIGS